MEINFQRALEIIYEKIESWVLVLIDMLPNALVASIILVIGLYLSKKIRNFIDKRFRKYFPTKTLADMSIRLVYTFCLGVVTMLMLKVLNLDKTITTALAGVGLTGVALAFAFQDFAANILSGIFLSIRKPFYVDEAIRVKEHEGFVVEVRIRDTTIRTYQGQYITIPNKDVFQNPLTNFTRLGKRRADIVGGVALDEDLRRVQKIALEALKNVPGVIAEDTSFFYEEYGESSMNFKVRIWVNSGERVPYLNFISEVLITLNETFAENNIRVPYPIRTLNFDIQDGESLSDHLIRAKNN